MSNEKMKETMMKTQEVAKKASAHSATVIVGLATQIESVGDMAVQAADKVKGLTSAATMQAAYTVLISVASYLAGRETIVGIVMATLPLSIFGLAIAIKKFKTKA